MRQNAETIRRSANATTLQPRARGQEGADCTLTWRFADADEEAKLNINQFHWPRPDDLAGAELIKENVQRQVWRVSLGETSYYVKLYFRNGRWWRLKRWLRGPVCVKEWQVAHYARDKGVDCIRPVAYAISADSKSKLDCLLITEALPKAAPLTEYWRKSSWNGHPSSSASIARLEDAIGELLAKAHQAGIAHADLHPGNLLVEPGNGRPRVYLVDLHSVTVGKAVSDRTAIHNLAQLNQWFRRNATITQRMRLLKRYIRYRRRLATDPKGVWLAKAFKHWAQALDQAAAAHSRRLWTSRDRRALKTGKYFSRLRLDNRWKAHVFLRSKHHWVCSSVSQLQFEPADWRKALAGPEHLLEGSFEPSRAIKHSRSGLVYSGRLRIGEHELNVVCKKHLRRKPLGAIWDCWRHSRSLRAWRMSFALLNRSLPVAQPLAVLERRFGPYVADNLLITEEITPSVNLRMFLTTVLPAVSPEGRRRLKRVLSERLATLLRAMHRHGFVHRDMKATNILIHGAKLDEFDRLSGDPLKLVLIDLDGLRMKRRCHSRDAVRTLARLSFSADLSPHVTRTDRARFLKAYLISYGSGIPNWKTLWRQIQEERNTRFQKHSAG